MQTIKVPSEGLQVKLEVKDGVVTIHGIEPIEQHKAYGDMVFDVPLGQEYFFINERGYVERYINDGHTLDLNIINLGVFLTREEAQKEADKRKAIAKLKQKNGARPFVVGEENFYAYRGHNSGKTIISCTTWSEHAGVVYFDTNKNCRAAHTPDIIKALWGE